MRIKILFSASFFWLQLAMYGIDIWAACNFFFIFPKMCIRLMLLSAFVAVFCKCNSWGLVGLFVFDFFYFAGWFCCSSVYLKCWVLCEVQKERCEKCFFLPSNVAFSRSIFCVVCFVHGLSFRWYELLCVVDNYNGTDKDSHFVLSGFIINSTHRIFYFNNVVSWKQATNELLFVGRSHCRGDHSILVTGKIGDHSILVTWTW